VASDHSSSYEAKIVTVRVTSWMAPLYVEAIQQSTS